MANSSRGMRAARAAVLTAVAVAAGMAPSFAGGGGSKANAPPGLMASGAVAVETVYFAKPGLAPVRLLRGIPPPIPAITHRQRAQPRPPSAAARPQSTQIVSFGTGFVSQVTVVRGGAGIPPGLMHGPGSVAPADSRQAGVTVLRGAAIRELFAIDLFGPANGGELDRIAFAVDGVESRHGADPRMWRPSPTGPQGPMQVTAAAAFDVGGGDRFDMAQNRLLGRAYLAQMYRRYGNWADAIAAYNWGPGNMDLWIAGGRNTDFLPLDVARYVALVLRDALVTASR